MDASDKTSSSVTYRCTLTDGWRFIDDNGESKLPSESANRFLPPLVEFLRRRPALIGPVYVILQVRRFGDEVDTILLLQETIFRNGSKTAVGARLLAPASYAREKFVGRNELERLRRSLRLNESAVEKVSQLLESSGWNYDLVLELCELDEQIDRWEENEKEGRLTATVKSTEAPEGLGLVSETSEGPELRVLWQPGIPNKRRLQSTICVPWLPPAQRFSSEDDCLVYLLLTGEARDVLGKVDQVWQSPLAKNLLLAAEPGSGKEVVSKLIHFGRARGNFIASSVGGETWTGWHLQLLGHGQSAGPPVLKGFIEACDGGTLLVDEIDKADREIRDALLRIIEADEFYRPHSSERIQFKGGDRPLFIFAGSGNGKEGLQQANRHTLDRVQLEPPKDFWQRMDRRIHFKHPLGSDNAWDWAGFKEYIQLFLWRAHESRRPIPKTPFAADRLLLLEQEAVSRQIDSIWDSAVGALALALCPRSEGKGDLPKFRDIRSAANELYADLWNLGRIGGAPNPDKLVRFAKEAVRKARGGSDERSDSQDESAHLDSRWVLNGPA